MSTRPTRRMPLKLQETIRFGTFIVNPQVFYITRLSFALVNLKPLMPGHVLVSPIRVVPRFSDLTSDEVSDLFLTAQRTGRMVSRVFKADSLNIAIQDGAAAGQSVPHVHAHVIPRHMGDLDKKGGSDAIYEMINGDEGNVGKHMRDNQEREQHGFPKPDVGDERKARSVEEMNAEADWLAEEMNKTE